jgi:Family of unknown function (DUF6527)
MKRLLNFIKSIKNWFIGLWRPTYRVKRINGDTLPHKISDYQLIHLIDDGESWSAALVCPCGCGDILQLALFEDASPRWNLSVDNDGRPTLHPSVWRKTGCKAHFWLRDGRVYWCGN